MKPTIKMSLTTLLGLLLPFGGVWGPLLIKPLSESDRKFRSRLMLGEVAIVVIGLIPSFLFWSSQMEELLNGSEFHGNGAAWLFVYPALLVVTAIGLVIFESRKRQ